MIAALGDSQRVNGFNRIRVVVLTVTRAVGGKVVGAGEALRGGIHRLEVERNVAAGPHIAIVAGFGASQVVAEFVALALYGEAGMERLAGRADRFNLYGGRQLGMQCAGQLFRAVLPARVKMKALAVGMHTGIGATAAMDLDVGGKDLREDRFEVVLHCTAMRLALPTAELGAIVGANTFPTHTKDSCQRGSGCKSAL